MIANSFGLRGFGNLTSTQATNFMNSIYKGLYQRSPLDTSFLTTYYSKLQDGSYTPDYVLSVYLGTTEYTQSDSNKQHWNKIGGSAGFMKDLDSNYIYHEPSTVTPVSTPAPTVTTSGSTPTNAPTTISHTGSTSVVNSGTPSVNSTTGSTVQGQPSNSTGAFSDFSLDKLPSLAVGGFSSTEIYIALGAAALALIFFGSRR